MASRSPRILCIGRDTPLLELRCAVLARMGYDAQTAFIPYAYQRLQGLKFDLVITSIRLAKEHGEDLYAAIPAGTQVLLLDGVTFPTELLAAVAKKVGLPEIDPLTTGIRV